MSYRRHDNPNYAWLEVFKPHNDGYKIHGTSFHYYPNGRWLMGANGRISLNENRWWKRCDDRILRPISIDTVLSELPPDMQDVMIWNIQKFKD